MQTSALLTLICLPTVLAPRSVSHLRRQVDAQRLGQAFAKHCFRSVLAVNEFVTLAFDRALLAFRVTAAHTLDATAREVTLVKNSIQLPRSMWTFVAGQDLNVVAQSASSANGVRKRYTLLVGVLD